MSRLSERIENFNRAFVLYEQAHTAYCADKENKLIQMALVQGFEIVFELAWKTMKDYLEYEGIKTDTPRETIKNAFLRNVISDGDCWIEMLEARNKTSHTYKEEFAKSVADEIIHKYLPELNNLEAILAEKLNG